MTTLAIILLASLAFIAWAAPVATARQTPAGIRLRNGHKSVVTFAVDPDISLWEMTAKPPGLDGGDAVDTTTMHNVTYRTKGKRTLKDLTDGTGKFAYDPAVITQLLAIINVDTTITYTFPDGTTWAFFGYLRSAEFDELVEGEMPTGTFTFTPTNTDSAGAEQPLTLVSVAGT